MKQPIKYQYGLTLKVRDYECDLQGWSIIATISATWSTRVMSFGWRWAIALRRCTIWVLTSSSTRSQSPIIARCVAGIPFTRHCVRDVRVKLIFDQIIVRSDGVKCASGVVEAVAVQNGRTTRGECFDGIMARAEAYSESHPYDLTILS